MREKVQTMEKMTTDNVDDNFILMRKMLEMKSLRGRILFLVLQDIK